ncbi:PfkB family carbohydrate kinase [Streptomyces sp. NPDC057580]|uniref:PfkB family carbohydrate kinase n=1 Tax=Streptomyces sp. NPDC057580 TaxID=3346173 RepID=UPI00367F5DC6
MKPTAGARPSVVTFGEALGLVHSTRPGGFQLVRDARIGFGGAEANVAIGLSRLGVDVQWVGRLGADTIGDLIERELRAEGVTASALRDPGRPTALMLKEHRVAGTTQVRYYRAHSAGSALAASDLDVTAVASADLLHVTGITPALSETARHATFSATSLPG